MQKIKINVTEKIQHTVTLKINDRDMKELISNLNDDNICNDIVGDYCNNETIDDGYYELDDFEIVK